MLLRYGEPKLAPFRLAHTRSQGGEQRLELHDGQVDGGRCNQRTRLCAVSATPCHKVPHVVVGDLGDEFVLAEKLDQEVEPLPCVAAASVMLTVRFPEPSSDIIEP